MIKHFSVIVAAVALFALALPSLLVQGQSEPPNSKFRRVGSPIPGQYIVVFNDDIPGDAIDSLALGLANIGRATPHAIYRYALKGFSIHGISEEAAKGLSRDPRVEFVEENCEGRTGSVQSVDYSLPHFAWHLDRIDQRDAVTTQGIGTFNYNQAGTGVHAYVLDSGILSTHTEFGGRVAFGADFAATEPTYHPIADGSDCLVIQGQNQGHGTQVAGALGAGTYGVSKNVTVHNIRICDCFGSCNAGIVIQGVDLITGQHIKPAVANMSLQLVSTSNALEKAIRKSMAAGVTYVVIAGNHGIDADPNDRNTANYTPSRMPQVITVASTTITDAREPTSSTGNLVDLFSPGFNTPSPIGTGTSDINDNFTGTSSAAPKVAGAAAMYLETDPTACPCTVRNVLTGVASSDKVSDYDPNDFDTPNRFLYAPLSWPTPTHYSLSLNGTSGYVEVPTSVNPNGVELNITSWITVEAWIKLNSNGVTQGIVERFSASDGGYALRITSQGKLRFYTLNNASSFDFVTGNTILQTGVWYHVAGVWGGLTMRVFVNGQLDSTPKSSTFAPGTGTSPLFIGRIADGGGFFNGLIDEARVTGTSLYDSDFTSPHQLTGVVGTKGLWRFDDQTPNDCPCFNNGTVVGGATFSADVP